MSAAVLARQDAVVCLVVGSAEHGVVEVALAQHRALADGGGRVHLVRLDERPAADALLQAVREAPAGPVLVHVTDKLFGRGPEEAADVLEALAGERRLVVALHDLPQASDGAVNQPRRAAAYLRTARAAEVVVVASRHEERLLRACWDAAGAAVQDADALDVVVVPLPVPELAGGPAEPPTEPSAPLHAVAVLGYLYPGKGHDAVVEALDVLPPGVGLVAWGRPSPGHEDLVDALQEQAGALGRTARVSGWVAVQDLPGLLRSAVVPVAPHAHLSASGSINAWVAAGRRPLVPRSDYAAELLERTPGCVTVYDDLREALARAWADPASTWAPPGSVPGPTVEQTAALVRDVLAALPSRPREQVGA
ncbi:glycosyltransferase [Streptomyces sp. NP160]|uniref:glycosyltransferase n=1 Tax=Streptomyces sp. NP160 TaxID=2586637 RepID=UPI0015D6483D|nr:glycosyltransferase [Streptomyces sp. NP160]